MRGVREALRTAVTYLVTIPFTVVAAALAVGISLVNPVSPALDGLVRLWARTWRRAAGVRLVVEGLEHIEPDRAYVVVSNHRSNFDIFAHLAALPLPIRFLAKAELFRIPLFGPAMRRIGMVEVDRGAGYAAPRAVNRGAIRALERGQSPLVYPEGTYPQGGPMLPFKKGAFSIARRTGAPILPTAIVGSRRVWEPDSNLIRSGLITVRILPPISARGLTVGELEGLMNRVRARISAAVERTPT